MPEIEIWTYEQMVYAQSRICPGEWDAQTLLGFWDTNGSLNLGQTTRPYNNQQKKETCRIVDFVVPADNNKIERKGKKDKHLDLDWELKKLWNMKVTVIPVVIGALCTLTKTLVQRLEDLEIRWRV